MQGEFAVSVSGTLEGTAAGITAMGIYGGSSSGGDDEIESGSNPNGIYEKASYHGKNNNSVKNKAPNKGQEALDNLAEIGPNTTRRIGISDGEIVVFDETTRGFFHGHVRSWDELSEQMKAVLRKSGM